MERRTMEEKKLIEFRNIVKSFDSQVVLKGINLDIYENEFVTLLGPSGCGKTTLLRILGGFLDADEGKVIFDNEDITGKPPYERELNTVFQKYALFPHLSVYENIAFGLKLKKMSKDIIEQKVMKMLKLIGLEGYEIRIRPYFPVVSSSVWQSREHWSMSRRYCFWMSRWQRWT